MIFVCVNSCTQLKRRSFSINFGIHFLAFQIQQIPMDSIKSEIVSLFKIYPIFKRVNKQLYQILEFENLLCLEPYMGASVYYSKLIRNTNKKQIILSFSF